MYSHYDQVVLMLLYNLLHLLVQRTYLNSQHKVPPLGSLHKYAKQNKIKVLGGPEKKKVPVLSES